MLGLIGDGSRTDATGTMKRYGTDMTSGKKRKLLEIIAGNVFLKDLAPHLPGALIGYNLAAFWWHLVEISYVF